MLCYKTSFAVLKMTDILSLSVRSGNCILGKKDGLVKSLNQYLHSRITMSYGLSAVSGEAFYDTDKKRGNV